MSSVRGTSRLGSLRPGSLRPGSLRPGSLRPGSSAPGGRARAPGAAYGKLAPVRPGGRWPGRASGPASLPRSLLQRAFARDSRLRHLDWLLLVTVLALSFIGTLLVWSATRGTGSHTYVVKQLVNIVIGITLMTVVSVLDYRQLRLYAPVLYAVSLLGLLAALTPLGTPVNGSKSWITLPAGFQIEPSEFGKLAIILMSAIFLSEARQAGGRAWLRAVSLTLGCALVPIVLVEREPDLGVVIIMLLVMAGLIALSGLRLRWLAALAAAGALAVVAVLKLNLLHAYQLHRLTSFANPAADPTGTGYNAAQAKIAVGSGGLTGQGLFHGQLIAGNFVPEQHTDFIFAVAGEELGFVGCAVIIGLLAILLLRALRIAAAADDMFGMLVASGIAIWFAVQSFINIGMTIGIMPVTGLPLPFVSYGGSAMFADMVAIGALQAVHRHRSVFG